MRRSNPLFQKLSPADGTIVNFGPASNNRIEQLKGIDYSIDALIGSTNNLGKFSGMMHKVRDIVCNN